MTSLSNSMLWSIPCDTYSRMCIVCPHHCILKPQQIGLCRVRMHDGNEIVPIPQQSVIFAGYGVIERHALYHFYPNSRTLVIGSIGCSASCDYCQNWEVSLAPRLDKNWSTPKSALQTHEIKEILQKESVQVLVFSINEFSVWPEGIDTMIAFAKMLNIKCVLVTNGFVSQQWQSHFIHHFDAIKIDLKSLEENSVRKSGTWISPVITYLERLRSEDIWIELSLVVESELSGSLIIDGLINLSGQLDILDIPVHLQRFLPAYKLVSHIPPSLDEMRQHRTTLMNHGFKHVYISNINGIQENNTVCPHCNHVLVTRTIKTSIVHSLLCPQCSYILPGRFNTQGTLS
jgi:pyruvate formate lyase activating enzyme